MSRSLKNTAAALVFLAPFILAVCVFFLYAMGRTVWFSLTQYDLNAPPQFVGWQNYRAILGDPLFVTAVKNTLLYSTTITFLQTSLGLLLAIAIDRKVRGISFFRTAFYFPSVLSSAAVTLIFLWIFLKDGVLNAFLGWTISAGPRMALFASAMLGMNFLLSVWDRQRGYPAGWWEPQNLITAGILAGLLLFGIVCAGFLPVEPVVVAVPWLSSTQKAAGMAIPLWAITLQNLYTTAPSMMLLFLAGLQNIPTEHYEAAKIEGGSFWQVLAWIIIPSLRPIIFLVTTTSLIGTLQLFDQVALYGNAVPKESRITLAYYIYDAAFPSGSAPQVGRASAAAMILTALTMIIIAAQRFFNITDSARDEE
jgi:multiple sugar transport system permease protein